MSWRGQIRAGATPVDTEVTRQALTWIAAFLGLRLISAGWLGLGVDESYSLAIARHLQLSYFDHPPLHQWIIHLFGGVLGYGRAARAPFVLLFAGSSWLLFTLTRRLFGSAAALWSVIAINLAGFFSVAAGGWILPDGPLIFCLLAAANRLAPLLTLPDAPPAGPLAVHNISWPLAGVWIGLAGLSKYQAVLFALGVALLLLTTPQGRSQLRRPGPYIAAVLAMAIVSPVIVWNAKHGWVSFLFQGGRASPTHDLRPMAILTAALGQMALLLPWVHAPAVAAMWPQTPRDWTDTRRAFCLALSLPGIVLFTVTPLWGQNALPHWSMPAWLFVMPLLGDRLARAAAIRRWPRRWVMLASGALLSLWGLLLIEASTGALGRLWPTTFPKGDPSVELVEWTPIVKALQALPEYHDRNAFIVSPKWMEAGKIGQATSGEHPIVVASADPRGFAYGRDLDMLVGHNGLVILRDRDLTAGLSKLRPCFAGLTPLKAVQFGRFDYPEQHLTILSAQHLRRSCSLILGPAAR